MKAPAVRTGKLRPASLIKGKNKMKPSAIGKPFGHPMGTGRTSNAERPQVVFQNEYPQDVNAPNPIGGTDPSGSEPVGGGKG
jgi:hypothetical protein